MSVRNQIHSEKAAPASGSYSQGLKWNRLFFTTVVPYDTSCNLVGDTMYEQTKQTMENLKYLLEEADSDLDHVLQVTAYLHDLDQYFGEFARAYEPYFQEGDYPARSSHESTNFMQEGRQCYVELQVIAACRS